jgi:hypothetical protein
MCDGCGCNTPKTPAEKTNASHHDVAGWHVHADGTSHQHDHMHEHHHAHPAPHQPAEIVKPVSQK